MTRTTPLRIVYIFDDGDEVDLASGTIDTEGVIAVEMMTEGEEESVETVVRELNASERVFVRDMSNESGLDRPALTKRPIERGMPGFLEELVATARRFYKVELRFDLSQLESRGASFSLPDDVIAPEEDDDELLDAPDSGYGTGDDSEPAEESDADSAYRT
ncbi:MAG: hypothetical protein AB3N15_01890 [Paracoccaceae bacterium]